MSHSVHIPAQSHGAPECHKLKQSIISHVIPIASPCSSSKTKTKAKSSSEAGVRRCSQVSCPAEPVFTPTYIRVLMLAPCMCMHACIQACTHMCIRMCVHLELLSSSGTRAHLNTMEHPVTTPQTLLWPLDLDPGQPHMLFPVRLQLQMEAVWLRNLVHVWEPTQ